MPARFPSAAVALLGVVLLALAACSTISGPPPVTVPEIVAMSKSGARPGDIIERIRDSGTVYRLTASQLAELEKQGVAPGVIDYMQQTYLHAVRREQARADWDYWSLDGGYWYGGCPYGWGSGWCY
jgi:hypothetical protein